jgi:hypothetical protein
VWQGKRATLLHGVAFESDTLRGVPFTKVPTCDSCRVRMALGELDSLRVGTMEAGFARCVGLVLMIGGFWGYLVAGVGGD